MNNQVETQDRTESVFDFANGPFTGVAAPAASDEFPKVLTHDDASEWLWDLPESEMAFGVDGTGEPVTVDLASDSPHVMVSAASGAGKSVIAASIATQALSKGASVAFFDVKRISHRWAKELPQVHYASEVDEIANGLVSIAKEVKRRMKVIEAQPDVPVGDVEIGPRIIIIAEELNSMMGDLEDFENILPRRGVYKPRKAFSDIVNLGRAAKVHVVGFAQFPDAKIIPKRMMESFGYKVLIRHTTSSWNMLAWQIGYCPPAPQQVGRGFVVMGDKAVQTQFLYMPEDECKGLVRQAFGGPRVYQEIESAPQDDPEVDTVEAEVVEAPEAPGASGDLPEGLADRELPVDDPELLGSLVLLAMA